MERRQQATEKGEDQQEQDAHEDRAPYLEVVTDWVKAVDALDTEDWPGDELLGMWESDPIRPSGLQEQRFGILGPVLSEDGLSIGLVVSARLRNYLGADYGPGGCRFWLSRADAQRLGLALLKQGPSGITSVGESQALRVPPEMRL